MIGAAIDRTAANSRTFERLFKKRIDLIYRTSIAGEAGIFLAASAGAGIFASCGNDIMFIISLVVAGAVWIQAAFTAGFLREWLYAVFLLIYFWLPGVFIIPGAAVQEQYDISQLLNDLSRQIWASPVLRLIPGADITVSMLIAAAVEIIIFLIGSRMRSALKNSSVYCRIRLDNLDNTEKQ